MSATHHIEIKQGATWRYLHTLYAGEGGGLPVMDLTGYSAAMQIRLHPDSSNVLVSLTSSEGIVITGLAGTLDITITSAITALLNFRKAVYDLYITAPTGVVTKLLSGEVNLIKRVTR